MPKQIKIGLAQINQTVGDISGNTARILSWLKNAKNKNVDLLVFPELTITSYPPEDLLMRDYFVEKNEQALEEISKKIDGNIAVIIGFIKKDDKNLYNCAALIKNSQVQEVVSKTLLPNYDVFNEKRYFTASEIVFPVEIELGGENINLGLQICEDIWNDPAQISVTKKLVDQSADLIVNLSASPYDYNKHDQRRELLKTKASQYSVPIALCNLVGAQDDLIFDGQSLIYDNQGELVNYGKSFEEDLITAKIDLKQGNSAEYISLNRSSRDKEIFEALVLGVKDYFKKSGFAKAVLGLSGGIDSALTACIAKEALGKENVIGITMPTQYTEGISITDAGKLTENLGIEFRIKVIKEIYKNYLNKMGYNFETEEPGIAEENLQSRIRGDILMSIANKEDALTLNTGNKTELALGYCTLYGDMCGSIAVLSDLSKHLVYELAEFYNRSQNFEVIPRRSIEREPTAELKFDQEDPFDYDIVGPLVDEIIVEGKGYKELIEEGYEKPLVIEILEKIRRTEYKRSQAAVGLKITGKAFGRGRRYPIINQFQEYLEREVEL